MSPAPVSLLSRPIARRNTLSSGLPGFRDGKRRVHGTRIPSFREHGVESSGNPGGSMLKLAPIAASLLLAACGGLSRHMDEPKDPERSLVYGFVDMSDGPCPLDWFSMKQVKPKVEEPYYSFRTC